MAADLTDCTRQRDLLAEARQALEARAQELGAERDALGQRCGDCAAQIERLRGEAAQQQAALAQTKVRHGLC